jgi:hypothetical protein
MCYNPTLLERHTLPAELAAALALRFSAQPEPQLQAIETLREDVPGATPGGSTSVSTARARLRARSGQRA